jgi:hypothetical protein
MYNIRITRLTRLFQKKTVPVDHHPFDGACIEETAVRKNLQLLGIISLMILVSLACQLSGSTPAPATQDPNLVYTQVALALTLTAVNNPPTVQPTAQPTTQSQDSGLVNTQVAMVLTQTAMSIPPAPTEHILPTVQVLPTEKPVPTEQDLESKMKNANILVYEDAAGDYTFIPYVKRALDSVPGYHEYVADAMGTFMDKLNSGTKWDLIISASEMRTNISGDYWTILKQKVDEGAALVSEIWYVNLINDGKIAPLLRECGLKLQSDWQAAAVYNRIDYGMYWVDSNNPVFTTPNKIDRFGASLTDPAWLYGDIGDLMEVTDNTKGTILATKNLGQSGRYGLISSCMKGRVIFQTFSSHNYPTDGMIALWENYIFNTLTAHFTNP